MTDKASFPFLCEQSVSWNEMDAFKHVNNARYFTYFENARMKFFEHIDMFKELNLKAAGPILAETRCRFIKAMAYPDNFSVGVGIQKIGNSSFSMRHGIWSANGEVTAEGEGAVVLINYDTGEKVRIPDGLRAKLEAVLLA